ncbi:tRNA (adenosine(37)-N6)-threonylcarbamoyltransferase complex ATPase subunit type 1 TsaE [Spongisporangium articulatum]|uniref:tRNA threonylcarbamoyladenosine biosynthesis protein TsaE n=1 Tax=Spongisporangium articulatum TaxID=3362603 RepID=A0ABW8AP61_9ACTN
MTGRLDPAHRLDPLTSEIPVLDAGLVVPTTAAMQELGFRLAARLGAGDLVILSGDLGAGKTTLSRGIGAGLHVRGEVTSPTFEIARVHPPLPRPDGTLGPALVHVDAYRLETLAEVDDLDLDASLAESVTVVEWGEGLVEGLATDRLQVTVRRPFGDLGPDAPRPELDEERTVLMTGYGDRWAGVALPLELG